MCSLYINMATRKIVFSADEAVNQILDWVESNHDDNTIDGEVDLLDLYGNDEKNTVIDNNIDPEAAISDVDDISDEEDVSADGPVRRLHRRKMLTYQRDVNSIDSATDDSNYDLYHIPVDTKDVVGYIPDKAERNKKIEVKFSNQKLSVPGRQRRSDIIANKLGITRYSRDTKTPLDAFSLFLDDDILGIICNHTNARIEDTLHFRPDDSRNYPYFKATNIVEMKTFIGFFFYRGLYGMNNHRVNILFSDAHGPPVFSATMPRMRFDFLLAHICFDDINDRDERWKHDRFAAIREIFERCNDNFGKALVPEDYLSLDETLSPPEIKLASGNTTLINLPSMDYYTSR